MFFTRTGLEQATRPEVADHHARRFVGRRRPAGGRPGLRHRLRRAGLRPSRPGGPRPWSATRRPPPSAAANLAGRAHGSVVADADEVADDLLTDGTAVFCDPARRTERGRLWRVEDFSPAWSLVHRLLDGTRTAGVKLGPALPHGFIPDQAEAEWITHRGDTVEVTLWAGPGASPGVRAALVGPDDRGATHRFTVTEAPAAGS